MLEEALDQADKEIQEELKKKEERSNISKQLEEAKARIQRRRWRLPPLWSLPAWR